MLLKSLFGIVGHRTHANNEWTYTDDDHADVYILDVDDEANRARAKTSRKPVVVFSRDATLLKGYEFTLLKPLRSRDLLQVLDQLDQRLLNQVSDVNGVRNGSTQTARNANTDCLDELFTLLRQYAEHQFSFRFDDERIFIDTNKKRVYFDTGFNYTSAVSGQRAEFTLLTAIPEGLPAVSLADFFYEFTVQEREAHLLAELHQAEKFQIKQWPQFINAANTKAMIRVSAYFSKNRASLPTAARELAVDSQQLMGFINAVHAQNLLVYDVAAPVAVMQAVGANQPEPAPEPVVPPPVQNSKIGGLSCCGLALRYNAAPHSSYLWALRLTQGLALCCRCIAPYGV